MPKLVIGLSAITGDTIYYGNRNTGEVDEFIVDSIRVRYVKDKLLTYEYYDKNDAYICSEEDLQRSNLLSNNIFCSNEAVRNVYLNKEKIGD